MVNDPSLSTSEAVARRYDPLQPLFEKDPAARHAKSKDLDQAFSTAPHGARRSASPEPRVLRTKPSARDRSRARPPAGDGRLSFVRCGSRPCADCGGRSRRTRWTSTIASDDEGLSPDLGRGACSVRRPRSSRKPRSATSCAPTAIGIRTQRRHAARPPRDRAGRPAIWRGSATPGGHRRDCWTTPRSAVRRLR